MSDLDLNNLSNNLYMLLLSLNRRILNPHELMKRFNVPHSHIKVLFYLIHHGSTSISVMAKELCISKPNMTPVLDKLTEDGFINRYYDPNDRRVIKIEATEKASEFLKQAEEYTKLMIQEKVTTLSDDEISTLSSSTENLLNIFSKL
jgi:DNA-binding MarR family transcriptional regulator